MVKKAVTQTKKLLTDVELEVMQVLWDLRKATVRDIMDHLPKSNQWAYTTVATMLKVLEKKGIVVSEKTDRAHLYVPRVSRDTYEAKTVRHLVDKVFRGSPSPFVMRLLTETKLSADEIASLRKILEGIKP